MKAMTIEWSDLQLFLAICEAGSFSAAARKLKVSQPTLSRRISDFELQIGQPLFKRQTQGVSLTAAANRLLPSAKGMAEWASSVDLTLNTKKKFLAGCLRVTAPPAVAFEFLAPFIASIKTKFPQLTFEVLAQTDVLNLARSEADIAIRTSLPTEPDLVVLHQLNYPVVPFASRNYIKTLPQNYVLEDVDWIGTADTNGALSVSSHVFREVPYSRVVFTSNDFLVQRAACFAGIGAMFLPKARHRFSFDKNLVELELEQLAKPSGALFLVCHKKMIDLPKVQIIGELIKTELMLVKL
jgi:DNA-binding transcriptional LysR family regulator